METTSVGTASTQSQGYTTTSDVARALNADMFLELLLTEIQNQDPLEPMSNSELCQQLGQIWQLQSNMELSETLQSVSLGQNLTAANSMIGRVILGLTDEGEQIAGYVDSVSIEDGQAKLNVGEYSIDLENVSVILDQSSIVQEEDS